MEFHLIPLFISWVLMEKLECKRRIMNINLGLQLPPNIVEVILPKLTICDLPACRLVSRTWNHLILNYASSCKFIPNIFLANSYEMHYSRNCNCHPHCRPTFKCNPKMHCMDIKQSNNFIAKFVFHNNDWSRIKIFNSCNGLLYIHKVGDENFCNGILNLMTNEFFILSTQPRVKNEYISCFYGFGFNLKTKQYKLFKLIHEEEDSHSIMEVMRFGKNETKEWSYLNCLPFVLCYHGVYLNGVIYWIGREKENKFVIYGLNVETEKIESITVLNIDPAYYTSDRGYYIGKYNGKLYATIWIHGTCCNKVQLWMMQGKDCWVKEFVVHDIKNSYVNVLFVLIKVFEDGERWFSVGGGLIFCYDKTGTQIKQKCLLSNVKGRGHLVGQFYHFDSLNFGSLPNILVGDNERIMN